MAEPETISRETLVGSHHTDTAEFIEVWLPERRPLRARCRRNLRKISVLGALCVAVVVGVMFSAYYAWETEDAHQEAAREALSTAVGAKDAALLEQALAEARRAGLAPEELREAISLQMGLVAEGTRCASAVRSAVASGDAVRLDQALASAAELGLDGEAVALREAARALAEKKEAAGGRDAEEVDIDGMWLQETLDTLKLFRVAGLMATSLDEDESPPPEQLVFDGKQVLHFQREGLQLVSHTAQSLLWLLREERLVSWRRQAGVISGELVVSATHAARAGAADVADAAAPSDDDVARELAKSTRGAGMVIRQVRRSQEVGHKATHLALYRLFVPAVEGEPAEQPMQASASDALRQRRLRGLNEELSGRGLAIEADTPSQLHLITRVRCEMTGGTMSPEASFEEVAKEVCSDVKANSAHNGAVRILEWAHAAGRAHAFRFLVELTVQPSLDLLAEPLNSLRANIENGLLARGERGAKVTVHQEVAKPSDLSEP